MDSDIEKHQKRLEAEIQRELDRLPELHAPATLSRRVMAAIEERASIPWYRQAWEFWPLPLRIGTLAVLLCCFGGLCIASWQLTRAAGFSAAMQEVGQLFSGVTALWNALNAVLTSLLLVFKHFGTGFIIATCLAISIGYAICIGLGTACYRLAFTQKS